MFAASRYETGSNLPADRCTGGWEFFELLYLSGTRTPQIPVDVHDLRLGLHQQGWYVWETRPPGTVDITPAIPSVPVPAPNPVVPLAPEPMATPPESEPVPVAAAPPPQPVPAAAPPPSKPAPAMPPPPAAKSKPVMAPPPPPAPRPAPATPPAPKPAPATASPKAVPVAAPAAREPAYVPTPTAPEPVTAEASPAAAATVPDREETVTQRPPHQVVWFDIPVRDLERAVRFYSAVLGAPLETVQAGFGMSMALLPHAEGAITGCLVQTTDGKPSEGGPLLYLTAQGRLDDAVAAAQDNGGTIVQPRHSIGSAGSRAIVIDSEGNRIALHST